MKSQYGTECVAAIMQLLQNQHAQLQPALVTSDNQLVHILVVLPVLRQVLLKSTDS